MRSLATLALIALAACQQEPTFDERYDAAREKMGTTASEIDEELERRRQEAGETEVEIDVPEPTREITPAPEAPTG